MIGTQSLSYPRLEIYKIFFYTLVENCLPLCHCESQLRMHAATKMSQPRRNWAHILVVGNFLCRGSAHHGATSWGSIVSQTHWIIGFWFPMIYTHKRNWEEVVQNDMGWIICHKCWTELGQYNWVLSHQTLLKRMLLLPLTSDVQPKSFLWTKIESLCLKSYISWN